MSLYGRVLAVRVANNELNLEYSTIGLALSKNRPRPCLQTL